MQLTATKRDQFGRAIKPLRAKGLIPAELYGHGLANIHLSVALKDFRKVFKSAGESSLVELVLDGKKHPVMIQDIATDPVSDAVLSVDFYQVRMDEKLKTKVPVSFVGESSAVKEKQGVLVKAMSELKVEALPSDLPHEITIDLAKLVDIGQSIHIEDLAAPKGVRLLDDGRAVVITVIAKMTEEEAKKLEEQADISAVKSETEEKVAERAAEKAAAAPTPEAGKAAAPTPEAPKK